MSVFKNVQMGNRNIITLPPMLTNEQNQNFAAQSQAWSLLPVDEHVLDFSNVINLDRAFCPSIAAFQKVVVKANKRLSSVNVSPAIKKTIESLSLESLFGLNQKSAPKSPSTQDANKIDVRFISPFLKAVIKIFEAQASTVFRAEKPSLRTEASTLPSGIVGIVALNGRAFRGNIALCLPTDVFLKIYERMLGEKHSEITDEIEDAVGELLNMAYGLAKSEWNSSGFDFQPAIPTVMRGAQLKVRQQTHLPVIVVPFASDIGTFYVEIATTPVNT